MSRVESFAPVETSGARILILGSMPGERSLRAGQYYAHPRNAFWWILGELLGASPELPYAERTRRLSRAGVALWDVLQTCVRPGSLDSAIVAGSESPNDFAGFFARQPDVTAVYFNGAKAEQAWRRHVRPTLALEHVHFERLPSTSPAHASLTRAEKLERWRRVTAHLRG